MGFYYISIFSIFLLGIVYAVLVLIFWGIARVTRGMPGRKTLLGIVGAVFLVLPVGEELWIAWNFGQACKEAGTFIFKKVQVDGFYDDTTGWGPRQLAESKYVFMESRDILKRRLLRVEPADDAARDRALTWYAEKIRGKQPVEGPFVVQPIRDKEQIVVAPNRIDAWRVSTIDRPTARYHYRTVGSHKPVAHQVKEFEDVVVDSQIGETIARRIDYARGANWFFIGLDRPTIFCKANRGRPILMYHEVLRPVAE